MIWILPAFMLGVALGIFICQPPRSPNSRWLGFESMPPVEQRRILHQEGFLPDTNVSRKPSPEAPKPTEGKDEA